MTTKELALDHFRRVNAGDVAGAAALVAEDCVHHGALPQAQGRAGFTTIITKLRAAFPDLQMKVEDVIVEGDRAMVRLTMTGTNQGPLTFVRLQLPATGKTVTVDQIHVLRVADNRIVETWFGQDQLALFRQLGVTIGAA